MALRGKVAIVTDSQFRSLYHVEGGHRYIYKIPCSGPGYVPTNVLSKVFTEDVSSQGSTMKKAMLNATPIGRAGTPEDMGHTVAFLVSDKAAFVTVESIRVDGGISMTTPHMS